MKKNIIFIILFRFLTCFSDEGQTQYTFSMHTTHTPEYSQDDWEKCEEMHNALARYCHETENVAEGFKLSIEKAIQTMADVVNLTANFTDIIVTFRVEPRSFIKPAEGSIIALTFILDKTMPAENVEQFKTLIKNLSEITTNSTKMIFHLNDLITIFNITSGTSWLHVHNLDQKLHI